MSAVFSPRQYVALLRRNRNLRNLWLAGVVSMTADWFHRIAIHTLLLLYFSRAAAEGRLAADAVDPSVLLWTTLAFMAQMLPPFFFSPLIGVLSDRFARRSIMIWADAARALLAVCFVYYDTPAFLLLMLALEVPLSLGAGFFDTAQRALLPDLVTRDDLVIANGVLQSTWGITTSIGALLGGVLVFGLGPELAFTLNAFTFVFSMVMVMCIHAPERHLVVRAAARRERLASAAPDAPADAADSFGEGIRYVLRRKVLIALVSAKPAWSLTGGMILTLHTLMGGKVFENWGRPELGIGLLHTARGVGGIVGSILAPVLFPLFRRNLLRAMAGVFLLYGIDYCIISRVDHVLTAAALLVFGTTLSALLWIVPAVILQQALPSIIRGRVFAIDQGLSLFFLGGSGVGAYFLSRAGFDPRSIALIAGAGLLVVGAVYATAAPLLRINLKELYDEAAAIEEVHAEEAAPVVPSELPWDSVEPEFVGAPPAD